MMRFALPGSILAAALFVVPSVSPAQTVSIVSGNGQLVCPVCPASTVQQFAPLVVLVTDATGKPAPNTPVSWTTAPTNGTSPQTAQGNTDANGNASFNFVPVFPYNGAAYTQTPVTATALNKNVQFIETTLVQNPQTPGIAPVQITLQTPGQALTGTAGQTSSTPIKVVVTGFLGGIPNIAVQLVSSTSPGPSVSCASSSGQSGAVLTDSTGTATCNPVFGSTIGTGSYQVAVGGTYVTFAPASLTVTAGPPAIVKIVSGDKQSVNPGAIAPLPLVAQVTDLGGNVSTGATVAWAVTQGSATLSTTTTTSNSVGQVSTRVTAGSAGGQILVQVSLPNTTAQATFTINVNSVITQFQIVSGNNQAAQQGKPFPQPLIVQVNNQAQPVQGVTVNFVVSSGSAGLSAASATTNAQGQAQVTASAGQTIGPVVVTASIAGTTLSAQTFNLTVAPPGPSITSSGFTNAAGFQPGFISPCGLATIFGTGLATGLQGYVSSFLAPQFQVAGVTVQFGTASAPILSVVNQNGQESVTVQVPCEVTPGDSVPVTVSVVDGGSTTINIPVLPISPGLFQTTMSDGKLRAVLVRPDGSFVSLENPARRGEIIRMYATGLGQTTPALVTGQTVPLVQDASGNLVPQDLDVNAQVVVGVNNAGVRVVSAKYAYGMVGVYEVQFEVPSDTATGNDAPFAIAVYQGTSLLFGNPSAIPIQ